MLRRHLLSSASWRHPASRDTKKTSKRLLQQLVHYAQVSQQLCLRWYRTSTTDAASISSYRFRAFVYCPLVL